jgi:hypothetical protein
MFAIPVGELPVADARAMVTARLGDVAPEIVDKMLRASRRIPFFLEANLDTYEARRRHEPDMNADDLPDTPDASVEHLLAHMPDTQREAAIALATIRVFDESSFASVVRGLNIPLSIPSMSRLTERFFVNRIAKQFKVHDILVDFVSASPSLAEQRRRSLEVATEYLLYRPELLSDVDASLTMLHGILSGWAALPAVPDASVRNLLDIVYRLHDAGLWSELRSMEPDRRAGQTHPVSVLMELFAALASRRITGVDTALRLLAAVEPRIGVLDGFGRRSFRIEVAYLTELQGGYSVARQEFRELESASYPFDPTDRTHVRARLYHADMLTMDGDLLGAARALADAAERIGPGALLDWAEVVRHRAHAFRFSYVFDQAERLYLQALQAATEVNAPGLVAKLHTNLAETQCWIDPERAQRTVATAIELNTRLSNRVEVAKCDIARAIICAQLGSSMEARAAIARSMQEAHVVGYQAAKAFATQASAIAAAAADDQLGVDRALVETSRIVERIGTYRHLRVVPAWLSGDEEAFITAAVDVNWIDPEGLETRLRGVMRR